MENFRDMIGDDGFAGGAGTACLSSSAIDVDERPAACRAPYHWDPYRLVVQGSRISSSGTQAREEGHRPLNPTTNCHLSSLLDTLPDINQAIGEFQREQREHQ